MRNNIYIMESVDSTNVYLKRLAEQGAVDGTVVIAKEQTSGKGRQGHSFESRPGGFYYSILIHSSGLSIDSVMTVTAKTGVCVCQALEEAFQIQPGIKWVNDVIYHEKKLCGILVEASSAGKDGIPYLIAGIGVNLNQETFPEDLQNIATSLKIEHGRDFSFEKFAEALTARLDALRENLDSPVYLEEYRRRCITTGQTVQFMKDGAKYTCRAIGIDEQFGLITEEGTLRSGEVSVRPAYELQNENPINAHSTKPRKQPAE